VFVFENLSVVRDGTGVAPLWQNEDQQNPVIQMIEAQIAPIKQLWKMVWDRGM